MKNIKTFLFALFALCLAAPSYAQLPAFLTIVEHGTTWLPGYSSSTPFNIICTAPAGYTFHGVVQVTEVRWQGEWTVINQPFNVVLPGVPHTMAGGASSKNLFINVKNGSTWPCHAVGDLTAKVVYWYGVPYQVMTKTYVLDLQLEGHVLYYFEEEQASVSLPW